MAFAILRTEKLKTLGNVSASASHNFRERVTLNADPSRTRRNRTSGAQSAREVVDAVKALLVTVPMVRKDSVLAIEYFIGASPEFFQNADAKAREDYFDAAEKWLRDRHGTENVIAVTRQYDETSPHICAYVVPINDIGRLNAHDFIGGREKLRSMQTSFAAVAAPFGLQRGIEGSKAQHQTVKEFYAKIENPTPQPTTEIPYVPEPTAAQKLAESMGIETEHTRALAAHDAARRARTAEIKARREATEAKARQYDVEKGAGAARERALAELRASATSARQLPLVDVLAALGCTRDPADPKNWRTPVGRVSVEGAKFYAHDLGKGGGGAIDLVISIEGIDYREAVQLLVQKFGSGQIEADQLARVKAEINEAVAAPKKPFELPQPVVENWAHVRRYLTHTRRLSAGIVDRLNQLGRLYADRYKNAVFVLGNRKGAELRGTGPSPFHGVRGEKLPFVIAERGEKTCAFVESSIDAISLYDLGFKGRIVATSGNAGRGANELAERLRKEGFKVFSAFDNDAPGDAMARALGEPQQRLRPQGKDWNDDLRSGATLQPAQTVQERTLARPSLKR